MSLIRIAFFDIDGTLVDIDTKRPSPHAVETLRRLREKGVRVCLATGRAPMEVPKFEGAYFDAYLTYNGSYCFNTLLGQPSSKQVTLRYSEVWASWSTAFSISFLNASSKSLMSPS